MHERQCGWHASAVHTCESPHLESAPPQTNAQKPVGPIFRGQGFLYCANSVLEQQDHRAHLPAGPRWLFSAVALLRCLCAPMPILAAPSTVCHVHAASRARATARAQAQHAPCTPATRACTHALLEERTHGADRRSTTACARSLCAASATLWQVTRAAPSSPSPIWDVRRRTPRVDGRRQRGVTSTAMRLPCRRFHGLFARPQYERAKAAGMDGDCSASTARVP